MSPSRTTTTTLSLVFGLSAATAALLAYRNGAWAQQAAGGVGAALPQGMLNRAQADRAWGPEQATGAPDVPQPADDGHAWASLSEDAQDEWLELSYRPTETDSILIYESYNPGAVSDVIVTDEQGARHQVFKGQDPSLGTSMAVLVLALPKPMKVAGVHIELASTQVRGWNEIDAVGLLNAKTGEIAWAQAARASTSYADPRNPAPQPVPEPLPRGRNLLRE
jgi:hypothetical protein